MLTRTKTRVLKPLDFAKLSKPFIYYLTKISNTESSFPLESMTISKALSSLKCKAAMKAKFDALIANNIQTLVPIQLDMHLVGCKWEI